MRKRINPKRRQSSFFKKIWLLQAFLWVLNDLGAQIPQISGIINRYAVATGIDSCTSRLEISDTSGFGKGTEALLIQMQGADVSTNNNAFYGITQSINAAGRYERVRIDSVTAGAVYLRQRIISPFRFTDGVQLVSIPSYPDAIVTDTLRPKAWDGQTGGILALEVENELRLNAPILADAAGFRGGAGLSAGGNACNFLIPEINFFYPANNWRGASKGEGIARPESGKEAGRGAQSNGGGGGNDHNSGGGGGGHLGDGGNGGDNNEPSLFGCDGYYPGLGGFGQTGNGRIYLGGGGGAGHSNNGNQGRGGAGGGIVYLRAGSITGASLLISASGAAAAASDGDGAGGGGAGGTILAEIGAPSPGLLLRADGGRGGNSLNGNANRCFGPGGGGSGGRIMTNLTGVALPAGGNRGRVLLSTNACNNGDNGAENGQNGVVETFLPLPEGVETANPQILAFITPPPICSNKPAFIGLKTNTGPWNYQWQTLSAGQWVDLSTGANFSGVNTDTLQVSPGVSGTGPYRCRIGRPGCAEIMSEEVSLQKIPAPVASFSYTQAAGIFQFSADTSYIQGWQWDFGDGDGSGLLDPSHKYLQEGNYTVTFSAWNECDTVVVQKIISLFLPPFAAFAAPDTITGCGKAFLKPQNNSSANTAQFEWSFPGGNPAASTAQHPEVEYTQQGNYTVKLKVLNNAGQDEAEKQIFVRILSLPTAGITHAPFVNNALKFTANHTNGSYFWWDFGDGAQSAQQNPVHTFAQPGTYVVTLAVANGCGVNIYQKKINAP